MSFNLDEDYSKRWIDKADLGRQKAECSICRKLKTFASWRVKTGAPVCERCKKAKREAQRLTGARHQTVRRITQTLVKQGMMRKKLCEVCGAWNVQAHHPDYTKPFHVIWLCVKHHNSFYVWEGYQFLQSSGVNLKPCVDLEEMLSASLAELQRQWQTRVMRDRETHRPEVFSRIKAMLQHHRFIGDDQKYRCVESSEILEWLSEATGGKQP